MTRLADLALPDGLAFANAGRAARGQKLKVHISATDEKFPTITTGTLCGAWFSSGLSITSRDTLLFKNLDDLCPRCEAKLPAPLTEEGP